MIPMIRDFLSFCFFEISSFCGIILQLNTQNQHINVKIIQYFLWILLFQGRKADHCRFFNQNLRGIFLYENGYIFQIKCTPNKCCHINPGQNHFFSRNIYPFLKKEQNCDFSTPVCSKFKGNFSP